MTLPHRHLSSVEFLGALPIHLLKCPEEETPFFAATRAFARKNGGPITCAFVDALPGDWGDNVVIHSSLAWLTPGLVLDEQFAPGARGAPQRDPPPFRHEPFPGWGWGVRGSANRNTESIHCSVTVGGHPPIFVSGALELDPDEDPEGFWVPTIDLRPRDRRIRSWLAGGTLEAIEPLEATIVQHGWGTFWCPQAATDSGFQLFLRATHRDVCPAVNGLRNVCFV